MGPGRSDQTRGSRAGRRLFIHIGMERTGTTSLQNFCSDQHAFLRRISLFYPKNNLAFSFNNHTPLVASYMPPNAADHFVRGPCSSRPDVLRSLMRDIDRASETSILLSAEHLSSRFMKPQILELASDFADFDCRVVVFVREPSARFFSAYATQVASGGRLTLQEFADQVLAPGNLYIRTAETIALWEEVFGRTKIEVLVHAPRRSTIEAFFTTLFPNSAELPPSAAYASNRSLGPSATEALRLINLALPDPASCLSYVEWLRQGEVRKHARRSLAEMAGDQRREEWLLDSDRGERLDAIGRADRSWLEERYGAVLEEGPAPLRPSRAFEPQHTAKLLAETLVAELRGRWSLANLTGLVLSVLVPLWERWRVFRARPRPGE